MKQADIALKGYRICARTPEYKVRFPQCVISVKSYKSILSFMNGRFIKASKDTEYSI